MTPHLMGTVEIDYPTVAMKQCRTWGCGVPYFKIPCTCLFINENAYQPEGNAPVNR